MDRKVKPIRDFPGPRSCVGVYVLIAFTMALFAGVVLMVGELIGLIRLNGLASIVCVAAIMVLGVALVIIRGHVVHAAEREYVGYLTDLSLRELIAARVSPEIDEASRRAITNFLNENHPGWSFERGSYTSDGVQT